MIKSTKNIYSWHVTIDSSSGKECGGEVRRGVRWREEGEMCNGEAPNRLCR
ncbi:hypothetical protein C1H46_044129 [Malus baccata]|uniref:Uncharacterized protein n=1 Tax=Malus baccata TaxID=106549 RepID=A0A540K7X8_MALBA|nr:hypothetical protein C1H46_044129 [Malus baccata]